MQASMDRPYRDSTMDFMYNLLFCDNPEMLKANQHHPYVYPFDVLLSEHSTPAELQKIIDDTHADPRIKIFAYNKQRAGGHQPDKKELLAVIVEIGMEQGLDVLASFNDGTARYINQTGKLLVWETTEDANASALTRDLFANSQAIIRQTGPWDKPRRPHPTAGNARITLLVSDGLYFGEGPVDVFFDDPLANPALTSATMLLQYLTEESLEAGQGR